MLDLKIINSVLDQFAEERGIPREQMLDAIESSLAAAYKKEYGKRDQVVRTRLDMATGTPTFEQVKEVVDETAARKEGEEARDELDERPEFNSEKHMWLSDAQRIKKDAKVGDELVFPLELETDFGRIAAQTARQVIMQKIREAEKGSILGEYAGKQGEIVSGTVQRVERGTVYVDLGRTVALMPFEEQIRGERFRTGERVRAYLYSVDEGFRGVFLRVSRAHPQFVVKLFELEAPELVAGSIKIVNIVREPGSRTKLAVASVDPHVDPVGSLVGQRGVRVSTVTSELGGERIDIIEHSDDQGAFVKEALSPAKALDVVLDEPARRATVTVSEDQQSLAIGRGGQNVRLAAKLTGWNIDIVSAAGDNLAETDGSSVSVTPEEAEVHAEETAPASEAAAVPESAPEEAAPSEEKPAE